jgi:hypothetical protein
MAVKKPLVITNGQIEQLQSTDSLASVDLLQLTNGNAGTVVIGTAVYISANDTVDKARANAVGTVNAIGLVADTSILAAASGSIQMDGILTATTGQWDAIAGTTGGLTKDVIYYLSSSTAGNITATAPTTVGEFVVQLGIAISTTELKVEIAKRIKL